MRFRTVRNLIAHTRLPRKHATVAQLRTHLPFETEKHMSFLAPMARNIARRVFHHAHSHIAELSRSPYRRAHVARMRGRGHRRPFDSLERNILDAHAASIG